MICQRTAQQQINEKNRLACVPCPYLDCCPCLGGCRLPNLGIEPVTSQLQMHCLTIRAPAISDKQCIVYQGFIFWSEIFSHKNAT